MFAIRQPKWRETDVLFLNGKIGGDSAGILNMNKAANNKKKMIQPVKQSHGEPHASRGPRCKTLAKVPG